MKILVDMNLSRDWCPALVGHGIEASHWSLLGDPRAPDEEIMRYARTHGFVVFTHDLDFGVLLALTRASGPSVVQTRTIDLSPARLAPKVAAVLKQHQAQIMAGALITIDDARHRVRILPLR
jgi:predicted nuclease of predicted toxin-antitoxin system